MLILITIAAFCATLLGGLFALRLKDRLHLVLGFSAGAVIGVAFFDLIPEAIELSGGTYTVSALMTLAAIGFVGYMMLDRIFFAHCHEEGEGHHHRGSIGAGSLSAHSFLDGIAIGLAFQVSATVGAIVAVAVLTHDFSDGINTVSLILKNGGDRRRAFTWLLIDAAAPVLGVLATAFFSVQGATLSLFLSLFAGFFLYIGASDLLPESHHAHPVKWTTFATVLGIAVIYLAIRWAGI
jgi:zinc transporter ZupT